MILNRLGWVLAMLLAFGCSTTPVKWYKAGVSQGTFLQDKSECEDSLLATGTVGFSKEVYTFEGCIEGKGYTAVPDYSQ